MKINRGTIVFETEIAGFKIRLWKFRPDSFGVEYGAQLNISLDYGQAAKELGECIMHALACEGKVADFVGPGA